MKILSIGNSFSQDAHRYLHEIAKKDGVEVKTVNLYIGGCSLRTHYINMIENKKEYSFCLNGFPVGIKVTIAEALCSDDWDIITLQQASHFSGFEDTYSPYIEALKDYAKKYCPRAKIFIHQTWAYANQEAIIKRGYESDVQMFESLKSCYEKAVSLVNANGIIPCGEVMWRALHSGIEKVHRDDLHASKGIGRYMLALTWYKVLLGGDVTNNDFTDFDEPILEEERKIAIKTVNEVVKEYYENGICKIR